MQNTGILLTNVGTPQFPTVKAVRDYLREFLSDPRIVPIPKLLWWPILHGIILRTRPKYSAKLYQKIWTKDGSPLLINMQKIQQKLTQQLPEIPVAIGMHYGTPSIAEGLMQLQQAQCKKIIVLPLFPQYSTTTTLSTHDRVRHALANDPNAPLVYFCHPYATESYYITAIVKSIQQYWQTHQRAEHLLFSFHSLPERLVKKGEPYVDQCHMTAKLIAKQLQLSSEQWSIAFQSRIGRTAWVKPETQELLIVLAKRSIQHLQVICPGFSVDCLETLEEIAIGGRDIFLSQGGKTFQYIPALNDSEEQMEVIRESIRTNNI